MASFSTPASTFMVIALFYLNKACDPLIWYPEITNLELLSSTESQILLTMQDVDSNTFCITFNVVSSTFSKVQCATYSDDISQTSSSDTDPSSTRVNSITEDTGIDMTRNTHSFIIGWNEIIGADPITIENEDIQSFTIISTKYITFVRLSEYDLYAITFESSTSNNYEIYTVQSNIDFHFAIESDIRTYNEYKLISFNDKFTACNQPILYEYTLIMPSDSNYYLNLTEITMGYNVIIDTRRGFGYLWGYSPVLQVYDILGDSIDFYGYNIDHKSPTGTAYTITAKYALCLLFIMIVSMN